MSNVRKRNAYRSLIVCMLVLLALTVLLGAGYLYTQSYLNSRAQNNQKEVERINSERTQEYNAAVAELNRQNASVGSAQWPAAAPSGWDVIDLSSFDVKSGMQANVTRNEMLQGGLLLVNRWHPMPADLTDDMMVSINQHSRADDDSTNNLPTVNSSITMAPNAVEALMALYKDARAAGLDMGGIIIEEGYRTMETQSTYWNSETEKYSSRYSGDALTERVRRTTAYPGTSDYQAGLSFKVYNYKQGDNAFSSTPLHQTEQGRWLYENCWKYGFVFRFPVQGFPYENTVDKSYKTGINVEMKVYRYVGEANAAVMNTLGLCLEEYIEYLMQHPHIALYHDGELMYEIYRLEGGYTDTTVSIPAGAVSYSASTDNMGGLVVSISY